MVTSRQTIEDDPCFTLTGPLQDAQSFGGSWNSSPHPLLIQGVLQRSKGFLFCIFICDMKKNRGKNPIGKLPGTTGKVTCHMTAYRPLTGLKFCGHSIKWLNTFTFNYRVTQSNWIIFKIYFDSWKYYWSNFAPGNCGKGDVCNCHTTAFIQDTAGYLS